MLHNYTRQRQGRDFSIHDRLTKKAEQNTAEAVRIEDESKKTLLTRLEKYKEEAERNAVPVDGNDPLPERPAPEKGITDYDAR